MIKKVLIYSAYFILALVVVAAIAYQFRTDPIAIVAGKRLSGEELPYPENWAFSDGFQTIAVESRIDEPHSVTVICWLADGKLYIPARNAADKDWPGYIAADNRIRLKVGDSVYPAALRRVASEKVAGLLAQGAYKYPRFAEATGDALAGTWVYEVGAR